MPTENVMPAEPAMTPERVLTRLNQRFTDTRGEFITVKVDDLDFYRLLNIMKSYEDAWHFYRVWIKLRA